MLIAVSCKKKAQSLGGLKIPLLVPGKVLGGGGIADRLSVVSRRIVFNPCPEESQGWVGEFNDS